jgi:polyhydroxyalkanoate synthesis regulator phasin
VTFDAFGSEYQCAVDNQDYLIFERSNRTIDGISGSHEDSNSRQDVKLFEIDNSVVFYFPRNLETFFNNLIGITIIRSKLKEIRAEDLKPFPDLKILGLDGNDLEVLEPNLFEFTQKLEWISLENNDISHIDSHVFDNFVGKLGSLWLNRNICELFYARDDVTKVNEIIAEVQTGICKNDAKLTEFLVLHSKTTGNGQQFEELKEVVEDLMKSFKKQSLELKEVKQELKTKVETLTEQVSACKNVSSKDLEQIKKRVKFLENAMAVEDGGS